jgi:uncharacterized RDD family membrane protein YckC
MAAQPAVADGPAPGLRFAPFLRRLIAYIIDEVLIGALSVVVVVVLAQVTSIAGENDRGLIAGLSIVGSLLIVLVLWFIYFPWCWSHGGQTVGGRLLGIRVVSGEDGSPIGFGTGIVRLIGYFVCQVVLYIGFIWALFDKRKRGWHDMIAGTSVVNA